ncbi:MAG: hypothetical protein QM698_11210 [Micropepsaceae bacterium]
MKDGRYAYRFDGSSMAEGTAWHLVGIGLMKIAGGKVTGTHRSSILPLKGQDAALTHTSFKLSGTVKAAGGFIAATITFVCTGAASQGKTLPVDQTLTGTFDFAPAGKDRYWLISSGARNKTLGTWAAEAVAGELIRLSA